MADRKIPHRPEPASICMTIQEKDGEPFVKYMFYTGSEEDNETGRQIWRRQAWVTVSDDKYFEQIKKLVPAAGKASTDYKVFFYQQFRNETTGEVTWEDLKYEYRFTMTAYGVLATPIMR